MANSSGLGQITSGSLRSWRAPSVNGARPGPTHVSACARPSPRQDAAHLVLIHRQRRGDRLGILSQALQGDGSPAQAAGAAPAPPAAAPVPPAAAPVPPAAAPAPLAAPAAAPAPRDARDAPPAAPTASSPKAAVLTFHGAPHLFFRHRLPQLPQYESALRRILPFLYRQHVRVTPSVALHQALVEDRQQPLQFVPPPIATGGLRFRSVG